MLTGRSRSLWSSFGTLRANLSTGPATLQSHYDVLGVTPAATQSDIKTAYYKLTLKYHPDRNKSAEAKEKFRSVTEAYEVLGNYRLRKRYDMGVLPGAAGDGSTPRDFEQDDAQTRFYKSRMERSQPPTRTGRTPIYDFDEWSRAHYGSAINRRSEAKSRYEHMVRTERSRSNDKNAHVFTVSICAVLIMAYMLASIDHRKYDVNRIPSKSRSPKDSQPRETDARLDGNGGGS